MGTKTSTHVSTFFSWFSLPQTSQLHNFLRVDRQTYFYIPSFNMVQIKHFVAFILAAATVIAPVAARPKRRGKSHQTVLTGTGQLNEFGNLKSALIQVNGKLLDPIPVDMDNHNVSNGRFLMTAPFNYQMEPFGAQVLNRNETTMKAITLKESALGSKGTIFELQLKPFAGETTENAVHVVPREDNKMFVRFFDRDNA